MTAAAAKASSKLKEKPFSFFKGVCVPILGFAVGWGGYSLVEQFQLVDPSVIRLTHLYNLKLQRMVQRQLPGALAQRMTFSSEQLDGMIHFLESSSSAATDSQAERIPFKKILGDCRPQEQMEWLTDHILEDVPYFFIADVFHSWAELHEAAFLLNPSSHDKPELPSSVFDSKELSQGVWKKMLQEVIPFDVAVRVLCVLARLGPHNAKCINSLRDGSGQDAVDTLLRLHKEYKAQLPNRAEDIVPSRTVDVATAVLVASLNDAAVHGRRFPWIGRSPSGPYPLLPNSRRDQWCRQFGHLAFEDIASGKVANITTTHYMCVNA